MIKTEALKRAMRTANVKWRGTWGEYEDVLQFFSEAMDTVSYGHEQEEKTWQEDPDVSYAAWEWEQIRSEVERLHPPKVFVVVGLAEIWNYKLPFGYNGLGEEPVAGGDLLELARLRLTCAADQVAAQLFTSAGLKNAEDRW